jgi:hypothetical protein
LIVLDKKNVCQFLRLKVCGKLFENKEGKKLRFRLLVGITKGASFGRHI